MYGMPPKGAQSALQLGRDISSGAEFGRDHDTDCMMRIELQ
jgi:hypothetical protein